MDRRTAGLSAAQYIRENFEPNDRIAVVAIDRGGGMGTKQRIAPADRVASDGFINWMECMNRARADISVSMNTFRDDTSRRTKEAVAAIRHAYLDLDEPGTKDALLARTDIPAPNYVLETSPGRHQAVWKVEGFTPEAAERLLAGMARDTGGDIAATDTARVMRLPGFRNWKYEAPHFVSIERLHDRVCKPDDFPTYPERVYQFDRANLSAAKSERAVSNDTGRVDRSAEDWRDVCRRLARGEDPERVKESLAASATRKGPYAWKYAERTVERAREQVEQWKLSRQWSPAR